MRSLFHASCVLPLAALCFGIVSIGCGGSDSDDGTKAATATGSASTTGSGGSGGGGPIVADDKAWTWVPFDDAFCGDGSTTGMGINPNSAGKKVIIYLQGGGACYSMSNCYGDSPAAAHFDGFGPKEFAEFTGDLGSTGLFDRTDGENPFKDFNFVFVPYCTGDIHSGNHVVGDLHFVGHANIDAYLKRIVATFPQPEQLVFAGSSAGGFGTLFNFYQVQTAFGSAPSVYIDDSGPFFKLSDTPSLQLVVGVWGLKSTVAPGCDKCFTADPDSGLDNLIPLYAKKFPGHRGSLLSSMQDEEITKRFMMTAPAYEAALNTLADEVVPQNPDFHVYYLTGTRHVWLTGGDTDKKLSGVVSNGVKLSTFLDQQLSGDAAWKDVRP